MQNVHVTIIVMYSTKKPSIVIVGTAIGYNKKHVGQGIGIARHNNGLSRLANSGNYDLFI